MGQQSKVNKMQLDIINFDGKAVGKVELADSIFGLDPRADILHRVVTWQRANSRAGTHAVKTVSDVEGSGKKAFKQKKTGNARQGEKYNVHMRGGATAGIYDILRRPIISEKTAKLSESNGIAFEVAADATKEDVARAIQAIYNVKPVKVNIVVAKGKVKSFRGRNSGTQRTVKKAYVSLPADAKLDLAANA